MNLTFPTLTAEQIKEYLKNPIFYFIAVPAVLAIWVVLAMFVFYPSSIRNWEKQKQEYQQAQQLLKEILTIEPQRLTYKAKKDGAAEGFDFTYVVNEFATTFSIPSSDFVLSTRGQTRRAGKLARSAVLSIKSIDIEKMAKFLSTMLVRWPDLQCEMLAIEKLPNAKNLWKVDMTLTYYY